MKLTFTRTSALLALALGLTACGGKATFDLGGPVTGLAYPGLVLTNASNGDTVAVAVPTPAASVTSFKLPKTIEYGTAYKVSITAQPIHQTCVLARGAGTAGRLATISIQVDCAVQEFTIGGTVTGLRDVADTTPTGLKITNGADIMAIEINGVYALPTPVAFGKTYGVSIVSQPTGKTCTIANPSGTVNTVATPNPVTTVPVITDPVNNINISCV
ncbi:MAG: hypothetical protein V4631_02870 [Pseudomonadota bacterium]